MEEINHKGTALENLIVEITAPDAQSKTGELQPCRPEDTWSVVGGGALSFSALLFAFVVL